MLIIGAEAALPAGERAVGVCVCVCVCVSVVALTQEEDIPVPAPQSRALCLSTSHRRGAVTSRQQDMSLHSTACLPPEMGGYLLTYAL